MGLGSRNSLATVIESQYQRKVKLNQEREMHTPRQSLTLCFSRAEISRKIHFRRLQHLQSLQTGVVYLYRVVGLYVILSKVGVPKRVYY